MNTYGAATDARPLVIAHGLFGSARNWGGIAKGLSDARQVVAVDMRNHGQSAWTETHNYQDMAADLAEVIESLGGHADLLGHSMGGKTAMVLALTRPDLLGRLIVADIAPVPYTHSQMPFIDAMRSVDLSNVTKRSEVTAQLAAAGVGPTLQGFFTQSLDLAARRWKLNLDVLAQDMPDIMTFPDIDGQFTGSGLFLAGAESDYVLPEHRAKIRALFPSARFARLKGAGHWLHADKPKEFEAAVRAFLSA